MYLGYAINADTMAGRQETIEQFLARGGRIKTIKPCDDRYANHTSRFHFKDLVDKEDVEDSAWKSHGKPWRHHATAPGGRIAPGLRNKTRLNQYKNAG